MKVRVMTRLQGKMQDGGRYEGVRTVNEHTHPLPACRLKAEIAKDAVRTTASKTVEATQALLSAVKNELST